MTAVRFAPACDAWRLDRVASAAAAAYDRRSSTRPGSADKDPVRALLQKKARRQRRRGRWHDRAALGELPG